MGRPKGAVSKPKKIKDPNKPKRPTSAYFYYVQSERERENKTGSDKTKRVAEWTKEVSERWRNISAKEKKPFEELAAKDKTRYTGQMAAYKGKDANKPKRPMSSYFLWLGGFREKNRDKYAEHKDLLRAAGESWKKLTEAEKVPWEKKAGEEKKKYEEAMKTYNKGGGGPAAKKPRMEADNGHDEEDEEEEDEDFDDEEDDE